MDLWQLRYFVSAAEHLNFTKAAESLHISQSALSKKIADLEYHFGVQLFLRGKGALSLTMAGQVFLNESRSILAKWDQTFNKIQQAASGNIGSLKIGYTGGHVSKILPPVIRLFNAKASDIVLDVERRNIRSLLKALYSGGLDVAFIVSNDEKIASDLAYTIIRQDKLGIALSAEHPLAGRKKLSLSELSDEPFVFMARSENYNIFDFFINLCASAGFAPNLVNQPTMLETVLLLVESGIGITTLSPLAGTGDHPNIRIIPLDEDHPIYLFAVWEKENKNPAIPPFLETLKKVSADQN
jgi:DNA-binding transcriptional LysR family regulator